MPRTAGLPRPRRSGVRAPVRVHLPAGATWPTPGAGWPSPAHWGWPPRPAVRSRGTRTRWWSRCPTWSSVGWTKLNRSGATIRAGAAAARSSRSATAPKARRPPTRLTDAGRQRGRCAPDRRTQLLLDVADVLGGDHERDPLPAGHAEWVLVLADVQCPATARDREDPPHDHRRQPGAARSDRGGL